MFRVSSLPSVPFSRCDVRTGDHKKYFWGGVLLKHDIFGIVFCCPPGHFQAPTSASCINLLVLDRSKDVSFSLYLRQKGAAFFILLGVFSCSTMDLSSVVKSS